MIAIVCGGRHYSDRDFFFEQMDVLHAERPISLLIEGGQRTWSQQLRRYVGGADLFASAWARERRIQHKRVVADWGDLSHHDAKIKTNRRGDLYDAMAGFRRNRRMLDLRPDIVVAFSPSGHGTANMVDLARAAGVEVVERRAP